MHSSLPKVLHPLAGKPLLGHVIDTARKLDRAEICVVYGHGGEAVPKAFKSEDLKFVLQDPQLGTGHALRIASPLLEEDGRTLILYGDVPLTRAETLKRMFDFEDCLALLTVELENPRGYGRIVRDGKGKIERIVEEKDASVEERSIREINTGIMMAPTAKLKTWLGNLKNENAQKEFYLTDIVQMAVNESVPVKSVHPEDIWEVMGINDRVQLAEMERVFQRQTAMNLMRNGASLADPARLDIRGEMSCGKDVSIDVNCIFEGRVRIDDNVRIGANCVLKDVEIANGTEIAPFSHIEGAEIGRNCRIGPYARIRR